MPRFFVDKENVKQNNIIITGEDVKHIKTVLRHNVGDKITVCDGFGIDYFCTISEILNKEIILNIDSFKESETEPKTKITLFQGLPKSDKMEMIIQKCVELGVYEIVPVKTERCVVKLSEDKKTAQKIERFNKISESAAKQCERGIIPKVKMPVSFKEAILSVKNFDGAFIPYEEEKENGLRNFIKDFKGKNIAFFIGPEGGFSKEEIDFAIENGIMPVTLGKRILRTETAGLCVISILLYELD